MFIQGITLEKFSELGRNHNSKSWHTKSYSRDISTVDSEQDLYRSKPFSWGLTGDGEGVLYVEWDIYDKNDWQFKVQYKILEEGNSKEFQGENYQTGKYGNPIELIDNEFDNLQDAYRYAKGIVMSEEVCSQDTITELLER